MKYILLAACLLTLAAPSIAQVGFTNPNAPGYITVINPQGTGVRNSIIYAPGRNVGIGTKAPDAGLHLLYKDPFCQKCAKIISENDQAGMFEMRAAADTPWDSQGYQNVGIVATNGPSSTGVPAIFSNRLVIAGSGATHGVTICANKDGWPVQYGDIWLQYSPNQVDVAITKDGMITGHIILVAPNGNHYKIAIDNTGKLVSTLMP